MNCIVLCEQLNKNAILLGNAAMKKELYFSNESNIQNDCAIQFQPVTHEDEKKNLTACGKEKATLCSLNIFTLLNNNNQVVLYTSITHFMVPLNYRHFQVFFGLLFWNGITEQCTPNAQTFLFDLPRSIYIFHTGWWWIICQYFAYGQ